jgi:3-isopropylmalate dehydrogenase
MKKTIVLLPGDGIGPEVVAQAKKTMHAIADRFGHQFDFKTLLIGAAAIDKTGNPLPVETIEACLDADAILLGAVGHPKFDHDPTAKVRPEQGLLGLRKALDLFANIRPVKAYPQLADLTVLKKRIAKDCDMIIYRELSSGIYFGDKVEGNENDPASDLCKYSYAEIKRISELAFSAAATRKKRVCLVDKANVLASSRLWRNTVSAIGKKYPDITLDYLFVDNAAMQLMLAPTQFDVILTSNMFGDILSDLSSIITGSLGMLPSASLGTKTALFEPVHGSYPTAAGKDIANPFAAILSAKMMLEYFNLSQEAQVIQEAVDKCLASGVGSPEMELEHTYSCSQLGDATASLIREEEEIKRRFVRHGTSTII